MKEPENKNEKVDPYKHKDQYLAWKERVMQEGVSEISKFNSILQCNMSLIWKME